MTPSEFEGLKKRLCTGVGLEGGREVAAHDRPGPGEIVCAMNAHTRPGVGYMEYVYYFMFPIGKHDAPRKIKAVFDHYFHGRAMLDLGEERRAA